ncbi:MAG: DUF2293 domain-containing protein [Bacteroidales bacterium]
MTKQSTVLTLYEVPGKSDIFVNESGESFSPPSDWAFLPAGDAAITRRVTKEGNFWKICYRKGRRVYTKGVWSESLVIKQAIHDVKSLREDEGYQRKLEYSRASRARAEDRYVGEFTQAILVHLNFHINFSDMALKMSKLIADHATPVGSGSVARTKMIPLEQRAAKAVNAWMRHKTTEYDNMQIKRVKGARREVRRSLAKTSNAILLNYRQGVAPSNDCPLWNALQGIDTIK